MNFGDFETPAPYLRCDPKDSVDHAFNMTDQTRGPKSRQLEITDTERNNREAAI